MLKRELILRNPLSIVKTDDKEPLTEGQFGAVLAKAGVGKTAFLVQLALSNLLRDRNVLHVSLTQPVRKVCLWYEEVFHNISREYQIKNTAELWETILPHRFIMTFNKNDFSIERFEERINDLTEQGIFFPQLVIIDGLDFDESSMESLSELKILSREMGFPVWFAITVNPDEDLKKGALPAHVDPIAHLFDVLIRLKASKKEINILLLKGEPSKDEENVYLDPSTLLIKDRR